MPANDYLTCTESSGLPMVTTDKFCTKAPVVKSAVKAISVGVFDPGA